MEENLKYFFLKREATDDDRMAFKIIEKLNSNFLRKNIESSKIK